ncbi:MAG: DsbC family protein [Rhodocyclaceae bacterium]|nr:DsbC family protein [Rhodocyclaceae bacterium]MBX3669438.1 DsbC family protein [Rhodocyclaceae bacterium]
MFRLFSLCILFALACTARADEAAIRKALSGKLGSVTIDKVNPTAYPGVFELVLSDRNIAYTNEAGSMLLVGHLIDVGSGKNLTLAHQRKLTAIRFDSLPLELAIKTVHGSGARKLAVFSDPLCPFCKRQEKELAKLPNVTIYTFLNPFETRHPGATQRARAVWCAPDRAAAWREFMLRGTLPAEPGEACKDPIARVVELGDRLGLVDAPTLVLADGSVLRGATTVADIEKLFASPLQ